MANRNEKLCDKSQNIHFSRTASSNIRMELIQINAVKNSNSKIKVRGNADTWNTDREFHFNFDKIWRSVAYNRYADLDELQFYSNNKGQKILVMYRKKTLKKP